MITNSNTKAARSFRKGTSALRTLKRIPKLRAIADYMKFYINSPNDSDMRAPLYANLLSEETLEGGLTTSLHAHTKQSADFLPGSDGLASLEEMFLAGAKKGLGALAITDHADNFDPATLELLDNPYGLGLGWDSLRVAKEKDYWGVPAEKRPILLPGAELVVEGQVHYLVLGSKYSDYLGLFERKFRKNDRDFSTFASLVSKGALGAEERRDLHRAFCSLTRRSKISDLSEHLSGVEGVVTILPHYMTPIAGADGREGWWSDAVEAKGNGEETLLASISPRAAESFGVAEARPAAMFPRFSAEKTYRENLGRYRKGKGVGKRFSPDFFPAAIANSDAHLPEMLDLYTTVFKEMSKGDFGQGDYEGIRQGLSKMRKILREQHKSYDTARISPEGGVDVRNSSVVAGLNPRNPAIAPIARGDLSGIYDLADQYSAHMQKTIREWYQGPIKSLMSGLSGYATRRQEAKRAAAPA